jgi:hypothetical protein
LYSRSLASKTSLELQNKFLSHHIISHNLEPMTRKWYELDHANKWFNQILYHNGEDDPQLALLSWYLKNNDFIPVQEVGHQI